jgi:hypothetical protein
MHLLYNLLVTVTSAIYTPMAASHFLGPSALPPLANTRPADEAGLAREEGISGFADAADALRFRLDDWTKSSAVFERYM